eukprot:GHVO01064291.1.p2 GENE.GHVO01064291.1~~GHVO01064291.1.p2  ORF type:complete len:231 (-),score=30.09 GHVO01064291.1:176-868(-)
MSFFLETTIGAAIATAARAAIDTHNNATTVHFLLVEFVYRPLAVFGVFKKDHTTTFRSSVVTNIDVSADYVSNITELVLQVLPRGLPWKVSNEDLFSGSLCIWPSATPISGGTEPASAAPTVARWGGVFTTFISVIASSIPATIPTTIVTLSAITAIVTLSTFVPITTSITTPVESLTTAITTPVESLTTTITPATFTSSFAHFAVFADKDFAAHEFGISKLIDGVLSGF